MFSQGDVAVAAGQGKDTPSRDVPFAELGQAETEWLSPRAPIQVDQQGTKNEVPTKLGSTVVPLWDIEGDGINDFGLNQVALRGSAATFYYAGKPCR